MKKITLNIYNYGTVTKIASFNNNSHDATKCMKHLNSDQVKAHGELPEDIFYFLAYTINKRDCIYVDYEGAKDMFPNDWKYSKKVQSVMQPA